MTFGWMYPLARDILWSSVLFLQLNGPEKGITKKWLSLKYAFMVKQNEKWKLVPLKYNLMVQIKRKLEKEVTTKISL